MGDAGRILCLQWLICRNDGLRRCLYGDRDGRAPRGHRACCKLVVKVERWRAGFLGGGWDGRGARAVVGMVGGEGVGAVELLYEYELGEAVREGEAG